MTRVECRLEGSLDYSKVILKAIGTPCLVTIRRNRHLKARQNCTSMSTVVLYS
jgi:hypothetical protein